MFRQNIHLTLVIFSQMNHVSAKKYYGLEIFVSKQSAPNEIYLFVVVDNLSLSFSNIYTNIILSIRIFVLLGKDILRSLTAFDTGPISLWQCPWSL